jgi:FkbM family methyltransferase
MLKRVIKPVLELAARNVPLGAQEVLLAALARRSGYVALMAEGDCGLIQGSSDDEVILPIYARTKTWAGTANTFLKSFFAGHGGTYLDIGANIGLTTLPVAQNASVRCIAFEPDPVNFFHLTENVRRNSKNGNIELHQLAAVDRSGPVRFQLNRAGNPGDHRIAPSVSSQKNIEVQAVALDEFLGELYGPVAIKVDVQGAEPLVVEGGSRVFAHSSALVLEYCPYMMSELSRSPETILGLLSEFDRIATIPDESTTKLDFRAAATAVKELAEFFNRAKADEHRYLDVYALRRAT